MTGLLDEVLAAHGGLDRWNAADVARFTGSIGGELYRRRGQVGILEHADIEVSLHTQKLVFHDFTGAGRTGTFEPSRTVIAEADGTVVSERSDPKSAFAGHTMQTPWDDQHILFAIGYGMWSFLTSPFLLTWPGVEVQEIEPWYEAGEEWRRLKARFPESLLTHSREQLFYFDSRGLMRRQDYYPAVGDVPGTTFYASEYQAYDGLQFPTVRRMYTIGDDGRSELNPQYTTLKIANVSVSPTLEEAH